MTKRDPICGQDFCGICGDCLHCYGGDPCVPTNPDEPGEHDDSVLIVDEEPEQ